jgi:replicative DNA helicase
MNQANISEFAKLDNIISENQINFRVMPHNVQAEQFLLGALLCNNDLINRISDFFLSEHFFEPVHQKIYDAITLLTERAVTASPVTLKNYFDKDESLKEIGGAHYLVKLASLSTTIINVLDYARIIYDLAVRRKLIDIGENIVNDAYNKEIEVTPIKQIELAEQELFHLASDGIEGNSGFKQIKSSLTDAVNRISLAFKNREKVTGISTGFVDMDDLLAGFQNSDLVILAGRPSMGKTAFAVNLALNCCMFLYENFINNKKDIQEEKITAPSVGFFSLEMSSEQLSARMLAMVSEVNSSKLRSGHITDDDFSKILNATKQLQLIPFFIDDTPAISIAALRTRARRLKRKNNLSLLVIDYLQLIRGTSKSSEGNRVQEISEITQGLKAIAKELNIPVIALSQLSRAVEQREDKRPLLSDLRESGSIEQDADIVMFIYRDEYYVSRKEPREGTEEHAKWQEEMDLVMNVAEVIVSKQRNGPIGNVKLHFNSNTTKFTNLMV